MWDWISNNKEWVFSGVGVAVAACIFGLLRRFFKGPTKPRAGREKFSQQAGVRSGHDTTIRQTLAEGGSKQEIVEGDKIGLDGEDIAAILEKVMEKASPPTGMVPAGELMAAHETIGRLEAEKKELEAAIRRAAAGDERGLDDAKAVLKELRKSGDTAKLLKFLDAQLALVDSFEERARQERISLNREIAAVAYLRGEIARAQRAADEILQLEPDNLSGHTWRGHILALRGDLGEAETAHRRVLELGRSQRNDEAEAVALGNLGLIYQTGGHLDEAEEAHRKALEIDERMGDEEGIANAYGNLGLIYQTRGQFDEAEEALRKALEIDERMGNEEGMAAAYGNIGLIYKTRGDLDEAEKMHRKALEIDKRLGNQEGMANQYGKLGLVYLTRGDLDEAEKMHRNALEIHERMGNQEGMAGDYGNLGTLYKARGNAEEAREYWSKARDLYRKIGMEHMAEKVQGWLDELDSGEKTA
ncbi:MAG: tetratricopeptide repeat protein [Planctomycetota bacterium]